MMSCNHKTARVFKALCDENRIQVLRLLQQGELCACDLLRGLCIGQSTLSHHMRILCDSGIVASRKSGKWAYYSINPEGCAMAMELLRSTTACECHSRTEPQSVQAIAS